MRHLYLGHSGIGVRPAAGAGLAEFPACIVCTDRPFPESGSVRRVRRLRDGGGGSVGDEIPGQAGNDRGTAGNDGGGALDGED